VTHGQLGATWAKLWTKIDLSCSWSVAPGGSPPRCPLNDAPSESNNLVSTAIAKLACTSVKQLTARTGNWARGEGSRIVAPVGHFAVMFSVTQDGALARSAPYVRYRSFVPADAKRLMRMVPVYATVTQSRS
jgi:hypothetical protein